MVLDILIRMVTGLKKTVKDVKRFVKNVMLDFGSTKIINARRSLKIVTKSTLATGDVSNVWMDSSQKRGKCKKN